MQASSINAALTVSTSSCWAAWWRGAVRHCVAALCLASIAASAQAWEIIDFEDVSLAANSAWHATALDQAPYERLDVQFNRTWNNEFNCCPGGWAVSNQRDQTTPGVASSFAALVASTGGGGRDSSQFAVVNNQNRGEARIDFPQPSQVDGMYVTNVTYTYLAVVDGNDGAGFVKGPFAAGDWLKLDAVGIDAQGGETGRSTIYLADYQEGAAQALDEWTWFDLSPLGENVSAIEFEMSSTDTGPFGMNTPAYFAVDDLTFHVVPEPGNAVAAVAGLVVCCCAAGRRREWHGTRCQA
jgi:hypothetical protein